MANGKSSTDGHDNPAAARGDAPQTSHKEAFEHWLEERLHQIFDTVTNEKVPDDLVRLIEQLKDKETAKGKK
jgi:hypothetical protein